MEELWARLSHGIITSVVSCKAGTGPPSCNCINISVLDTVSLTCMSNRSQNFHPTGILLSLKPTDKNFFFSAPGETEDGRWESLGTAPHLTGLLTAPDSV